VPQLRVKIPDHGTVHDKTCLRFPYGFICVRFRDLPPHPHACPPVSWRCGRCSRNQGSCLPGRVHPQLRDQNRRDTGKSQSTWTDSKMETPGSPWRVPTKRRAAQMSVETKRKSSTRRSKIECWGACRISGVAQRCAPSSSELCAAARRGGWLAMSRGGCQHRWTFLVNGEHGDSMTSRRDSPSRRASGRHLRESLPGRFQPQIRDTNRRDIGKSQPIWPIPRWKRQYIMRRTESTMPVPVG
jgi:hypothetical protein